METVAAILATYVLTLALTQSDGAWGVMARIRQHKPIDDFGLLNCFLCTSAYIAMFIGLLFWSVEIFFISWAGAVIIDKVLE